MSYAVWDHTVLYIRYLGTCIGSEQGEQVYIVCAQVLLHMEEDMTGVASLGIVT